MKIEINDKLWKQLEEFEVNHTPSKMFDDINKIAKKQNNTFTSTPAEFFNHMQERIIEFFNLPDDSFGKINSIYDIDHVKLGNQYSAHLIENGEIYSDIIIAYADKGGNTIIAQQVGKTLIDKVQSNGIDYLYNKDSKNFIYLTYDLNSQKYAATIEESARSLSTLGYATLEMFPSNDYKNKFSPFKSADEVYELYESERRGNVRIDKMDGKIKLIKTSNTPKGSSFYIPSLLLLAIYKLSHPEIGFDILEFDINDQNGKLKISSDNQLKFLNDIYTGKFEKRRLFLNFDMDNYINKYSNDNGRTKGNVLIYGAPGTGKSYYVENVLKPNYSGFERVTFFEEYDYTDFVGGLKPVRDDYGNINYDFVPGSFTNVLVKALNNPNEKYLLIIEELNRANASSVFGEIFQLLDRDDNGNSRYEIFNHDLLEYLDINVSGFTDFKDYGIKMPGNMSIVATMNPSDQGVHEIDSAFKRRWSSIYMPITFDNSKDNIGKTIVSGFDGNSWKDVGEGLNRFLIRELHIDEDSQLGQHFMSVKELEDIDSVASKLLGYLWNDVARYNRKKIFKTETLADTIQIFKKEQSFDNIFTKDVLSEF